MFTGIVTDIGHVLTVEQRGDRVITLTTRWEAMSIPLGASIACAGVCLTVVAHAPGQLTFEASAETLDKTTTRHWQTGTNVNLERSLRVGDELGGHFVSGHVDGLATVVERTQEGDSVRFVFETSPALVTFVATKGSVALDGVSLTVNTVQDARFGVNVISHTLAHTTFGQRQVGDIVNLEIDPLARYVARFAERFRT